MSLFDQIERSCNRSAQYSEPEFAYLNFSGRRAAERVRHIVETWYQRYPTEAQAEFCRRFRSRHDWQHQAAFFELYLYELLRCLDCQVTLHPSMPHTTRHPDFLAVTSAGERFYLEAVVVTSETKAEQAARARVDAVYDSLNRRVDSPDFWLWLSVEGWPKTPPPGRKLAGDVSDFLAKLSFAAVVQQYRFGLEMVPHLDFEHKGWRLVIRPIPKGESARGKPGIRPVGLRSSTAHWVDHVTAIRSAVLGKAKRYGELDAPYIIAVNVCSHADEEDILEALLGREICTVFCGADPPFDVQDLQCARAPDGVWTSPAGPQCRRVTGVLTVTRLTPWRIAEAPARLYHNPWSAWPIPTSLLNLSQAVIQETGIAHTRGNLSSQLFGLPESWPDDPATADE